MRIDLTRQAEALRIATHLIEAAQRGTGRTNRMLDSVGDDDLVVCSKAEHFHLNGELKARRSNAKLRVIAPEDFFQMRLPPIAGDRRVHFSHGFIQQLIEQEILDATKRLECMLNSVNADINKREAEHLKRVMLKEEPLLQDIPFKPILPCRNSTPDHLL